MSNYESRTRNNNNLQGRDTEHSNGFDGTKRKRSNDFQAHRREKYGSSSNYSTNDTYNEMRSSQTRWLSNERNIPCWQKEEHLSHEHTMTKKKKAYAPQLYSVQRGTVTRIETFGAFVQLQDFRAQGLVHKSQLANIVVNEVSDVVDINQNVWVKVLEVSEEDHPTVEGKKRLRVRLSMKYVSQDDGVDLDPSNEGAASDVGRVQDRSSLGHDVNNNAGSSSFSSKPNPLEQELNSSIGIATAIDPLSIMNQGKSLVAGSGLILKGPKGQDNSTGKMLFNGYALVGDDEGELPLTTAFSTSQHEKIVSVSATSSSTIIKAQGRGRGTTLPAWMTQSKTNKDQKEGGPVGMSEVQGDPRKEPVTSEGKKQRRRKKRGGNDAFGQDDRDSSVQSPIENQYFSCSSSSSLRSSISSSYHRRRHRERSKRRKREESRRHRHERKRKAKSSWNGSQRGKDERKARRHSHKHSSRKELR